MFDPPAQNPASTKLIMIKISYTYVFTCMQATCIHMYVMGVLGEHLIFSVIVSYTHLHTCCFAICVFVSAVWNMCPICVSCVSHVCDMLVAHVDV